MKCSTCGQVPNGEKLPRSWKRKPNSEVVCADCIKKHFIRRAVTFPVAGPIGELDWPKLRELLKAAWAQSTSLANWTVTALAKAEAVRSPGDAKIPKAPNPYLYPAARKQFPEIEPTAVVAIQNGVARKYNATRYETLWTCERSLANFKYPYPYPVPASAWKIRWLSEKERVPIVSIRLGGERIELRLRGGSEFRHQLGAFEKILAGDAIPGELLIRRQATTGSDHQNGVTERGAAGGSAKVSYRVMIQMAAFLPRKEYTAATKELLLSTTDQEFWVAVVEGAQPWVLNCDHVRRWQRAHRNQLDRLSQDSKHEKRWPTANRRHMQDHRDSVCKKYRDRIDTFCSQSSALLSNFAKRQGVGVVCYDDSKRGYLPEFNWSGLRLKLGSKLDEYGIKLELKDASADVVSKTEEPLAES